MTKNFDHQAAVRQACAKNGIELDELGPATGRFSHQLEQDLLGYDIVFATARMAIEAAAVGLSSATHAALRGCSTPQTCRRGAE
ncbi:hypothetical protein [Mesorhizobium sp. M0802]|uniref:hypothetical protein n=1 Tax=Mesorhizobium sp. M0802 TaxID=2957001 RepID=UPI00333B66C0